MHGQDNTEYWNWKFFDNRNPSDLNQLYVEVELPRAISWDQGLSYDAYTYGSSHGTLDIKDDRFISYDYPYFPAGEPWMFEYHFRWWIWQSNLHQWMKLLLTLITDQQRWFTGVA